MHTNKTPVPVWPLAGIQGTPRGTYIASFEMPDNTRIKVEYATDEEYLAAQYKARATARGIVRSQNPQAFKGI